MTNAALTDLGKPVTEGWGWEGGVTSVEYDIVLLSLDFRRARDQDQSSKVLWKGGGSLEAQ